jgi:hypothetical protein
MTDVRVETFEVRAWLAAQLACAAHDLELVGPVRSHPDGGLDATYNRAGHSAAEVVISGVQAGRADDRRTVTAFIRIGRRAYVEVGPGDRVVW